MLPLLFHIMALIFATSSWTGKLADYPVWAFCIWFMLSEIILFLVLPYYTLKKRKAYDNNEICELPDFNKTLNIFQWAIVAWIALFQATCDFSGLIYPNYKETLNQTLPMLVSIVLYIFLHKYAMKEFRRLELPILDPEQSENDFLRARLMPLTLVAPPLMLWLLIEDLSKGGLEIVNELTLTACSPVFFILLFITAPRLFNWAWKSKDSDNEDLNSSIQALANQTKTPINGVKIWNTFGEPVANAAVAGLSKKFRYVYITEYMIQTFEQDQIKAVVAHELGHLKLGHIKTYTLYSITAVLLALIYRITVYLYFPQINTEEFWFSLIEGLTFVFLFILAFTALSRFSESQADAFSAINTSKEDFIGAISQIEPTSEKKSFLPNWLMLHPTNEKRIKNVLELNEINNQKLLQQARHIRYAMCATIIVLTITAWNIGKPITNIHALYKAVRAGNAQLSEKLFNSMPEWLKKHPEVLKIKDTSSYGCAKSCS